MVYPVFDKETSVCAECERKIFDSEGYYSKGYITVRDNYMIANFFQFEDGRDNIFCDETCLAKYLSAETVSFDEEDENNERCADLP